MFLTPDVFREYSSKVMDVLSDNSKLSMVDSTKSDSINQPVLSMVDLINQPVLSIPNSSKPTPPLNPLPITDSTKPTPLNPLTQLQVTYSPINDESFFTRCEETLCYDFSECVLILPPFLTKKEMEEPSTDFCYGANKKQYRIANWGDIDHELRYYQNTPYLCHSYKTLLTSSQWYHPYFHNSPTGNGLYHLVGPLRSRYISEWTVFDYVVELSLSKEDLAEIVGVNQYYMHFFQKHQSHVYHVYSCRCDCNFRSHILADPRSHSSD